MTFEAWFLRILILIVLRKMFIQTYLLHGCVSSLKFNVACDWEVKKIFTDGDVCLPRFNDNSNLWRENHKCNEPPFEKTSWRLINLYILDTCGSRISLPRYSPWQSLKISLSFWFKKTGDEVFGGCIWSFFVHYDFGPKKLVFNNNSFNFPFVFKLLQKCCILNNRFSN